MKKLVVVFSFLLGLSAFASEKSLSDHLDKIRNSNSAVGLKDAKSQIEMSEYEMHLENTELDFELISNHGLDTHRDEEDLSKMDTAWEELQEKRYEVRK